MQLLRVLIGINPVDFEPNLSDVKKGHKIDIAAIYNSGRYLYRYRILLFPCESGTLMGRGHRKMVGVRFGHMRRERMGTGKGRREVAIL